MHKDNTGIHREIPLTYKDTVPIDRYYTYRDATHKERYDAHRYYTHVHTYKNHSHRYITHAKHTITFCVCQYHGQLDSSVISVLSRKIVIFL